MRGGVFICYRREDTAGFAGRIYDRLKMSLGRESVFIDVDNIPAGRDFVEVLTERVARCEALVALIGSNWLTSADKNNRRRLDDRDDYVRVEIQAALERNVPVIPVLVDGAAMPQAHNLPDALKKLARRQSIEISHNRFDSDAERLTDALAQIDGGGNGATAPRVAQPRPGTGAALWLLALVSGLVVVGGAAGFVYEQRGVGHDMAPQEQKAAPAEVKPTSDVPKAFPPSGRSSAPNAAPPPPNPVVIAAAPPPDNSSNVAVPTGAPDQPSAANAAADSTPAKIGKSDGPDAPPDNANNGAAAAPREDNTKTAAPATTVASREPSAGTIADSPPAKVGKAVTAEAPTTTQQWMNVEDFLAYYRGQINWIYPDKAWGRCQNGVSQRGAHWSPRPPGQYFLLHGTNGRTFRADAADMTAKGFKMQYDNVFPECDGSMHHQTLWMKEE